MMNLPYEERYNSYHAPAHRQWLRVQRPLTIANREKVAVTKEIDHLVQLLRPDDAIGAK